MLTYVPGKELKPFRVVCAKAISEAQAAMKEKQGIKSGVYIIGSGKFNLVTRNEDKVYDLDFNILCCKIPNDTDLKKFKGRWRRELDKVFVKRGFSHGQDSRSVITYVRKGNPTLSVDIGIIKRSKAGRFFRLIHLKGCEERFIWNEVPDSKDVMKRSEEIRKSSRAWQSLRDRYLERKNRCRGNKSNPSFVTYVEAVNDVWQKYCGAKEQKKGDGSNQ